MEPYANPSRSLEQELTWLREFTPATNHAFQFFASLYSERILAGLT